MESVARVVPQHEKQALSKTGNKPKDTKDPTQRRRGKRGGRKVRERELARRLRFDSARSPRQVKTLSGRSSKRPLDGSRDFRRWREQEAQFTLDLAERPHDKPRICSRSRRFVRFCDDVLRRHTLTAVERAQVTRSANALEGWLRFQSMCDQRDALTATTSKNTASSDTASKNTASKNTASSDTLTTLSDTASEPGEIRLSLDTARAAESLAACQQFVLHACFGTLGADAQTAVTDYMEELYKITGFKS